MNVFKVSEKNGKKGPGKVVTIVATKEDGDKVVGFMKASNPTVDYVIGDEPMIVETADEFTSRFNSEKALIAKRESAMKKLNQDDLVALGLTK